MGGFVSALDDGVPTQITLNGLLTRPPGQDADRDPGRVLLHRLSPDDASRSFELAESCARLYPSVHDSGFLADAAVLAQELPRSLREAANEARLDDRKHVFIVSGNTVHPRLEDTPPHWRDGDSGTSGAYAFLLALYGSLLGDLIGWATQQDGRIVTDVVPVRGLEQSLVSSSSAKELGWHTEDAFSRSRADHVGLFCLRTRGDVATTLSYVDLRVLPRDVAEILWQKRFHIHPDSSHNTSPVSEDSSTFDNRAEVGDADGVALLSGSPDAPVLRIDRDFTIARTDDPEAAGALAELISHLDGNTYEITLGAGDIGFIDNRNVVHGRRPFRARYDGKDRWLKRINVVSDLRRTRQDRPASATRVVG